MLFKKTMLAAAFALFTAALAVQAHADALDSIMAAKVIKVAPSSPTASKSAAKTPICASCAAMSAWCSGSSTCFHI
jgi:hypothetical protein